MATFPFTISITDPNGATESCRLLDDRIREAKDQLASAIGLPTGTPITAPLLIQGVPLAISNRSQNNGATPNSKFDLTAALIQVWNPNDKRVITLTNPPTVTCDVLVAGPIANGRDQAAAFGASQWLRFYWIYNPVTATLASLASQAAYPTLPTLPPGFTHAALAAVVRYNATPLLVPTGMRGAWALYETAVAVLTGGLAVVETPIDLTAAIPPEALAWNGAAVLEVTGAAAHSAIFRLFTGANWINLAAKGTQFATATAIVGNVNQNIFYLLDPNATNVDGVSVSVIGYLLPFGQ